MQLRKLLLFLLFTFFIAGCKKTRNEMLTGKWQAVSQDNPELDMMIQQQRLFTDTVGKSTSPEQNLELYQTNNMDSLKGIMNAEIDAFVAEQKRFLENTTFYFREDSIAVLNFAGNIDSTKWYFNENGRLFLDEKALKGEGQVIEMDVIELEKEVLKLKFNVQNFNSTVTFKPVKN